MKINIVNGPNLNMIGIREPEIYGSEQFSKVIEYIKEKYNYIDIDYFQSNSEGEIIDYLYKSYNEKVDGIVLNPGAYTHYSYAIMDAILSIKPIKVVEVHISNVNSREEFRSKSVIASACIGQISGFKSFSYILGIEAIINATKN